MTDLVDCRTLAQLIDQQVKDAVEDGEREGRRLCIREIIATDNDGVLSYARTKQKKAGQLNVDYQTVLFPRDVYQEDVLAAIGTLNADTNVHGIMVGLPVYKHLSADELADSVSPSKDIDGLSARNGFFLMSNQEHHGIAPATAAAAIHILETLVSLSGARVLVLGRGRTVGRPLAAMLTNRDATVTVAHSRTLNIPDEIHNHDIIIAATGQAHFVRADWLREGQVIIDCGISFNNGKTMGDVEPGAPGVKLTPVPGGVGVVTNSMLFLNLLRAVQLQSSDQDHAET